MDCYDLEAYVFSLERALIYIDRYVKKGCSFRDSLCLF